MAVATALVVGAGITAASSAYAANKSSNAAKNAANIQSRSADRAMDLQRSIYNQQMQMQSPFVGLGQQSAMTLGRLTGVTPGSRFAAPPMQAPMGMGPIGGVPRAPMGPAPMAPGFGMATGMPAQSQIQQAAARPTLGSLAGMRY